MRSLIKLTLCLILVSAFKPAFSATVDFDGQELGKIPKGWISGVTGKGQSKWTIETDSTAPSPTKVLKQSAEGKFPWCVVKNSSFTDGFVEVQFKAISGEEDQAAGLIWRWKDGDNYYITRANALENNISVYYMKNGRRHTLKYVNASKDNPVSLNKWHTLRVGFVGINFKVLLNGEQVIDIEDEHIRGAGSVGLWTKADSVTSFDDFSYSAVNIGAK